MNIRFRDISIFQKMLAGFGIIIFLMVGGFLVSLFRFKEMQQMDAFINKWIVVAKLAREVVWLDEVLTQSTRNYVFTGDSFWKERHDRFSVELDKKIIQAKQGSPDQVVEGLFIKIDEANRVLIELERESHAFVEKSDWEGALRVLDSSKYAAWKEFYANAVHQFLILNESVELQHELVHRGSIMQWVTLAPISIAFIALVSVGIALLLSLYFSHALKDIESAVSALAEGELTRRVRVTSQDEIGKLGAAFNKMALAMQQVSSGFLEQKLKELSGKLNDKK